MMAEELPTAVELRVSGLAGHLCTISAPSSWSLWTVKEEIAKLTGVPACEQVLLLGHTKLEQTLPVMPSQQGQAATLAALVSPTGAFVEGQCLHLTLLRVAVEDAIGWQVRHSEEFIMLRHVGSGFVIELTDTSNGWFRFSDGGGTEMVTFDCVRGKPQRLSMAGCRLAEEAADSQPEKWPAAAPTWSVGTWTVAVAMDSGSPFLAVVHEEDGELLLLNREMLLTVQKPQAAGHLQNLLLECLARAAGTS